MIDRRNVLFSTTAFLSIGVVGLAVGQISGCQQSPPASQWLPALQAIGIEVNAMLPEFIAAGMPTSLAGDVQAAIADIQQVIGSLTMASTATEGQSVLTEIETYLNYLAPLVLPFVSLIPGGATIALIIAALPAIEALIGLLTTTLSPVAQSLMFAAPKLTKVRVKYGESSQQYLDELLRRAAAAKK